MAKKFGGFTPEQLGKIVPEMQGMQADEQAKFLAATPGAAARVGKMGEVAQKRIGMAEGGLVGVKPHLAKQNQYMNELAKKHNAAKATQLAPAKMEAQEAQHQQRNLSEVVPEWAKGAMGKVQTMPAYPEIVKQQFAEYAQRNNLNNSQPPEMYQEQRPAYTEETLNKERQANASIEEYKGSLIKSMGFDPSTIKSEEDYLANKDKMDAFKKDMEAFFATSPAVKAAKEAQASEQKGLSNPALTEAKDSYASAMNALQEARTNQANNPSDPALVEAVKKAEAASNLSQESYSSALEQYKTTEVPTSPELISTGLNDPSALTTDTKVAGTALSDQQLIDPSTGQLGDAPLGTTSLAVNAEDVTAPTATDAASYDPALSTEGVTEALDGFEGAEGTVSKEVEAAQGTVSEGGLADTDVTMSEDRIQEADAGRRGVGQNEIVEGATLDTGVPKANAAALGGDIDQAGETKFESNTPQAEAKDMYELTPTESAKMTATTVQDAANTGGEYPTTEAAVSDYKSMVEAAQGTVGAEELVNAKDIVATAEAVKAIAATMDTLNDEAVANAAQGTFSQNMLAKAAQGSVPAQATVSGQMDKLMAQFNDGTPAWAAPALRAATAAMAARGMSGSSMASAAMVQAMMESAMPIAQADAATFERMGMKNLDNRQAVSMANALAQQGLTLQNLSNEQAAAMANSTNAFSLQSTNLSNQQSVILTNAQLKAGLQEQVLTIDTQTSLANASKYAERKNLNLNNSQQASLQRSSENLSVEMANLSNEQQTALSALQVKAALMGQELSNEQQMAVLETTQSFEAAKFDASSQQQAFMQDAAAQAALEGRALDARQQTQLFNVSAILEERKIDLTNEQQTKLFNTTNKVSVDMAEMSNRQQTALANVQVEATLRGQELSNKQQAAVLNAEKFAEANNLVYTTEAQMSLANSQMMQTIGLSEMSASNAAALQNAATLASMDMANLNNRQQAQVENAKAFLQMDLTNLNNEQESSVFKMQSVVNSMLSDTAATNASAQFNASSQQQTDQFFANLTSTIGMFNNEQTNTTNRINAGEANAMEKFNGELINMRDQFNAGNSLVIEQSNTNWFKTVATNDTAALNEGYRADAAAANNMTNAAFNAIMQETRDLMSFAWQTENNDADRAVSIGLAKLGSADAKAAAASAKTAGLWSAIGSIGAALFR